MKEFKKLFTFIAKVLSLAILFLLGMVLIPLFGAIMTWDMNIYFEFIKAPAMSIIGAAIGLFLCAQYIYSRTSN